MLITGARGRPTRAPDFRSIAPAEMAVVLRTKPLRKQLNCPFRPPVFQFTLNVRTVPTVSAQTGAVDYVSEVRNPAAPCFSLAFSAPGRKARAVWLFPSTAVPERLQKGTPRRGKEAKVLECGEFVVRLPLNPGSP